MKLYAYQPSQVAPPPPGAAQVQIPSQGTPASPPPAQPGAGGSMLMMLVAFLPIVAFMYFSGRSQQKKQKDLENKLKKGDRIVTQSGIVGRIVEMETRHARVEIAPGVKIQILRTSIAGLDAEEAAAPPKGKDQPAPASEKK